MKRSKWILPILILLVVTEAFAAEEIVPEGLPSESVVPKVDSPYVVRNRLLKFEGRFEASLAQGWLLDEPYFKNTYQGLEVNYGFTDRFAAGIKYINFNAGIGTYAEQFKSFDKVNYDAAPQPKSAFGLTFHDRFFYGKWNFSQDTVFPTVIEAIYQANMIQASSQNLWMVGAGLSQLTYFGTNLGVGLAYHLYYHQWVDPNSVYLKDTKPAESEFKTKTRFSNGLELKLLYLF